VKSREQHSNQVHGYTFQILQVQQFGHFFSKSHNLAFFSSSKEQQNLRAYNEVHAHRRCLPIARPFSIARRQRGSAPRDRLRADTLRDTCDVGTRKTERKKTLAKSIEGRERKRQQKKIVFHFLKLFMF
jgi:hypothetical protein